jgi:hypothetical protein
MWATKPRRALYRPWCWNGVDGVAPRRQPGAEEAVSTDHQRRRPWHRLARSGWTLRSPAVPIATATHPSTPRGEVHLQGGRHRYVIGGSMGGAPAARAHACRAEVTEAGARAALAGFDGLGGLERWIAGQRPWKAVPGGWTAAPDSEGWRFKVEPAAGEVRTTASMCKGSPAVWLVLAAPAGRGRSADWGSAGSERPVFRPGLGVVNHAIHGGETPMCDRPGCTPSRQGPAGRGQDVG